MPQKDVSKKILNKSMVSFSNENNESIVCGGGGDGLNVSETKKKKLYTRMTRVASGKKKQTGRHFVDKNLRLRKKEKINSSNRIILEFP